MVVVCLVLLSRTGFAAERGVMEGKIDWPRDAGGWKKTGEAVSYEGRAIFDYMDGAGEVYLAYNFKNLKVQRFERAEHPAIVAEAYEMGTPQDAFGVFAWERQDPDAGVGQGSEIGGGLLRFWKGRYFFSIYGESEGEEQAVLEIGRRLASSIAGEGGPPRLMGSLPEEHRVEGSVRFVRSHVLLNQRCFISDENILGLEKDTEAVFARYDLGKERTFVLVVGYPAHERATSAAAALKAAHMLDSAGMAEAGGWTAAGVEGRYLVVALHAPKEEAAGRLIQAAMTRLKEEP